MFNQNEVRLSVDAIAEWLLDRGYVDNLDAYHLALDLVGIQVDAGIDLANNYAQDDREYIYA